MSSILIVDDEDGMRKSLAILFKKEGYQVYQANSGLAAIDLIGHKEIDLVITDLRMDVMNGAELLKSIRDKGIQVPVIIMTAYGTIDSAVSAMKTGAYDYITKPFECDEILHRANKAILMNTISQEMNSMLRFKTDDVSMDFSNIIGESRIMKDIRGQLRKIAKSDFPVLITGETGAGKNLIAKSIHLNSSRSEKPFIAVNCTSIPEHLFESELFGHTKGAFTGAVIEREGLFGAAQCGTLLLDEIGAIPKSIQVKLLGVLQDNTIRKIGRNEETEIDVRIIAATNVDLMSAIKRGEFREDLYYRLNVLHIHIPPLRAHKEDIPVLANHFSELCKTKQNKSHIVGFTPDAIDLLYHYDYPGNIRELYNIMCHAVVVSGNSLLSSDDLPTSVPRDVHLVSVEQNGSAPLDLKEWEKTVIIQSIKRHPQNLSEVCRELKIGRTTLWRKMKQYNIDIKSVRVH